MNAARYRLLADEFDLKPYLRIRFFTIAIIFSPLALIAFTFCIVWSVLYDFASSTATGCHAYNVLPSVSSAIGAYSPQREVWKLAILFQAPMRFLMIYLYLTYNMEVLNRRADVLIYIVAVLNFVENVSLITLSLFDSSNHYPTHEKAFIIFVITSEMYMLLLVFMQQYHREVAKNLCEARALKWKKRMVTINIIGIVFAMYYFIEHNFKCPNYSYTKFAFCEYLVVVSNIGYHLTAIYDFNDRDLVISRHGLYLRPR